MPSYVPYVFIWETRPLISDLHQYETVKSQFLQIQLWDIVFV